MRIQPLQTSHILFGTRVNKTNESKDRVDNSKDSAIQQFATVGAGIGAIIGGVIVHKGIKARSVQKIIDSTMSKFPQDIEYRKVLLQALNLPETKLPLLRSIIGGQEYKAIISEFSGHPEAYTPGKSLITAAQDDYHLAGVVSRDFRVSLHNHTLRSDGEMTVQELLDQAAEYADEVFKVNKEKSNVLAPDAPFTIAITDHDTLEGCKEAVKIILENPEKYKNLRVVFGTELSVENRMLGNNLTKPVPIHMVVNCVNPFDKSLNEFLEATKIARKDVAAEFFGKFVEELNNSQVREVASRINMDEAREFSATLKEGLNYPWYYLKSYIKTKLYPSEEKSAMVLFDRVQTKYEPKLELQNYCMDMSDVMDIIREQKYGYMTIAHPALTPIGGCIKNPYDSHKHLSTLISLFKVRGGEKALATEVYYPYFGDVGRSKDWLENIANATRNNGLYPSGGLDSHCKNIFYSAV